MGRHWPPVFGQCHQVDSGFSLQGWTGRIESNHRAKPGLGEQSYPILRHAYQQPAGPESQAWHASVIMSMGGIWWIISVWIPGTGGASVAMERVQLAMNGALKQPTFR